ncbi:MAG: anhydro-N-acetylmuramic acid kinase [Woeseiaceae bacterium]
MTAYYIGLMSGTSMDGIDAAVVSFDDNRVVLHATVNQPYPEALRKDLVRAAHTPADSPIEDLDRLDALVGECFREAALEALLASGIDASDVAAIGSHGQTLRHRPDAEPPYSLQIGNPEAIASGTGIVTVADFRRADIAAGGQGAPLVPPFHDWLFGGTARHRTIVNVGGIANVTLLGPSGKAVTGFDTGPGNTLLDRWIQLHCDQPFDRAGGWAAAGQVIAPLLDTFLEYAYFAKSPPKSTGLEEFNLEWLTAHEVSDYEAVDVQATLSELTARTIAVDIQKYAPLTEEIYVCGGGAHNTNLLARLARALPEVRIDTTATVGLHPDWVEAAAFAWLAMRTVNNQTGNLPSVTGAHRKVVLGAIHLP